MSTENKEVLIDKIKIRINALKIQLSSVQTAILTGDNNRENHQACMEFNRQIKALEDEIRKL